MEIFEQGDPLRKACVIHYGNAALAFVIRLVVTSECKRDNSYINERKKKTNKEPIPKQGR